MWKVLLVISAVVLGGAAYLSWTNWEEKKSTAGQLAEQQEFLEKWKEDKQETEAELAQIEQSIEMLGEEKQTLEMEKVDLDAKLVEAKSNLQAQEMALAEAKQKLEGSGDLIKDINQVAALQKQMLQIRTQIEETEIELTQLEGATAAAQVERERLASVAEEMAALRQDQQNGVIRGPFKSQIKEAYNKWGFVVVDGGSDQGVVDRALLNVYRRGQPICRLLVTSVDAAQSAADIIPGSLSPGQIVQAGDTVVKAERPPSASTPSSSGGATTPDASGASTSPAAGSAAPSSSEPSAAPDPFGGSSSGGGMEESNAAPDPFGGGDAAPDPFGGGGGDAGDDELPNPFQ